MRIVRRVNGFGPRAALFRHLSLPRYLAFYLPAFPRYGKNKQITPSRLVDRQTFRTLTVADFEIPHISSPFRMASLNTS